MSNRRWRTTTFSFSTNEVPRASGGPTMSDDLLPGFAEHWIETEVGRIFARSAGSGPPIVMLHGFPQTHVCWHRIAPALADTHYVVCLDLRGYGRSSAPPGDPQHETY